MDSIKSATPLSKKLSEKIGLAVFLVLYSSVFIFRIPRMIFDEAAVIWIQASAYGLLGISGIFLFRHTFFAGFQNWKTAPLKNILWLLGAYVGSMLLWQIASAPAYMMGAETAQNDVRVLLAVQMLGLPLSILIIGLAGPVVEEVIYRAFLIEKRKLPLWACVILSSILFALVHLHGFSLVDFTGVLPHFSIGVVYGIVYALTRNITLPLVTHVMTNMMAVILLNSM